MVNSVGTELTSTKQEQQAAMTVEGQRVLGDGKKQKNRMRDHVEEFFRKNSKQKTRGSCSET